MPRNKSINDVSKGLKKEESGEEKANSENTTANDDKVLSPSQFRMFPVLRITKVSHNTKLIRFEIPPNKSLGLAIGKHITVRAEIDGIKVMRAYTPTSRIDQKGYFELLIKSYEFGKMSNYLHSLKPGDLVEVRGPIGRFQSAFIEQHHRIGLIAAGTGITPILQFLRNILLTNEYNSSSTTMMKEFVVFYQNRSEEDILLEEELDVLVKQYPKRLQVKYFLSNARTEAFGRKQNNHEYRGYINTEMIRKEMMNTSVAANGVSYVGLCGPSGFNEFIKKMLVEDGKHTEQSIFVW